MHLGVEVTESSTNKQHHLSQWLRRYVRFAVPERERGREGGREGEREVYVCVSGCV